MCAGWRASIGRAAAPKWIASAIGSRHPISGAADRAGRSIDGQADAQRPSREKSAVQGGDSLRRLFLGSHGDERESARAARLAVGDEANFTHMPRSGKCSADRFLGRADRQITNINPASHAKPPFLATADTGGRLKAEWVSVRRRDQNPLCGMSSACASHLQIRDKRPPFGFLRETSGRSLEMVRSKGDISSATLIAQVKPRFRALSARATSGGETRKNDGDADEQRCAHGLSQQKRRFAAE